MTDKQAIEATYVDYRRIKGRKVHQVIFEVPSETWPETYAVLGEPTIEASHWFAIAKMNGAEPVQNKGGDMARSAAMLCDNPNFRIWIARTGDFAGVHMVDTATAAREVRQRCGVESRAHLDHDDEAAKTFRAMRLDFEQWIGRQSPDNLEAAA